MKIGECDIIGAVSCSENEKLDKVAAMLRDNQIKHVYVVSEEDKLLGVLAAIDLINKVMAEGKNYLEMTAKDVMNTDLQTFTKEDDLTKAFGFMSKTNIMTIPVVENQKLVGVLSYKEAMKRVIKEQQKYKQ